MLRTASEERPLCHGHCPNMTKKMLPKQTVKSAAPGQRRPVTRSTSAPADKHPCQQRVNNRPRCAPPAAGAAPPPGRLGCARAAPMPPTFAGRCACARALAGKACAPPLAAPAAARTSPTPAESAPADVKHNLPYPQYRVAQHTERFVRAEKAADTPAKDKARCALVQGF